MTGAELLEQVREELLESSVVAEWHERAGKDAEDCVICNLNGCVLLTREETVKVRGVMELLSHGIITGGIAKEWNEALALLEPKR